MRGMEIATLPLDSERIALAVEQAGAHGFFKDFTPGYDTLLGNRFEGREELSIGDWQKIALTRAFWWDSPIFVLVEPTSCFGYANLFEMQAQKYR